MLQTFTKSFDSCQPAQSAQADMGRTFSLSLNFLRVELYFLLHDSFACFTNWTIADLWIMRWCSARNNEIIHGPYSEKRGLNASYQVWDYVRTCQLPVIPVLWRRQCHYEFNALFLKSCIVILCKTERSRPYKHQFLYDDKCFVSSQIYN